MIRERLRPFSHVPGTACLLPGTQTIVRAYPSRLEVGDQVHEFEPVEKFTVQQDLEKGLVKVFGGPSIQGEGVAPTERLSLGMNKKQDWDLIVRRSDLKEILPIWFRLGQWTPGEGSDKGPSLLKQCWDSDYKALLHTFMAGFDSMMVPTDVDCHHWGFGLPPVTGEPHLLLSEGAKLIRSLFFQESDVLHFLPRLFPQFSCGRMTGIQWSCGTLDMEWTKKKIRKVTLICERPGTVHCRFQSFIKRFRLRKRTVLDVGVPFDVSQGEIILLDRFEK